MADVATVLSDLETAGTEKNRTIYRRHGAREPQFGVSFADLRSMAKKLKRDDALARALWATGNTDARLLACMVADPRAMTDVDLDAWLAEIDYYVLVDVFVGSLASQVQGILARSERWRTSDRDWTAQAGWDLVATLAADPEVDDAYLRGLLATIERGLPTAGNRTRHAMNGAVISIGVRDAALKSAALAAAARIGPVIVDHGETGCVTPVAGPYIEKTWAYQQARAAKAAERGAASRAASAGGT